MFTITLRFEEKQLFSDQFILFYNSYKTLLHQLHHVSIFIPDNQISRNCLLNPVRSFVYNLIYLIFIQHMLTSYVC